VFSTGQLPDGVVLKACGSRRETRCPSCAAVYRADARHLVRAGLIGGKGVPEEVMHRPAVLLTLTAPSFGAVHTAKDSGPCHPASPSARCAHGRSLSCFVHHEKTEACVGSALCEDCYDYEGAVLHNATTPELWRRTTIYLVRHLAQVLGKTQAETKALISLSFCRVVDISDAVSSTFTLSSGLMVSRASSTQSPSRSWLGPHCPLPERSRSPIPGARHGGDAKSTCRRSTVPMGNERRKSRVTWRSTPPRVLTKTERSTPVSPRSTTWPGATWVRTFGVWPKWHGRSVTIRNSVNSTCIVMPMVSATAGSSSRNRVATRRASAP
jgi:hypothetical protein